MTMRTIVYDADGTRRPNSYTAEMLAIDGSYVTLDGTAAAVSHDTTREDSQ